jgi:hypothetical protein
MAKKKLHQNNPSGSIIITERSYLLLKSSLLIGDKTMECTELNPQVCSIGSHEENTYFHYHPNYVCKIEKIEGEVNHAP